MKLITLVCSLLFVSHVHANSVDITDLKLREFIPGASSSVAYFTLSNTSKEARTLVGVNVEGIGRAELHQHQLIDGMMKMSQLPSLEIPAGQSVTFEPGGLHLMLFEPDAHQNTSDKKTAVFIFKNGEQISSQGQVISLMRETHDHSHHH